MWHSVLRWILWLFVLFSLLGKWGVTSAITLRDGKQLEDPVVKVKGEIGSDEPQSEKAIGENEKPFVSPPHEPKIPLTQEFSKSKLDE